MTAAAPIAVSVDVTRALVPGRLGAVSIPLPFATVVERTKAAVTTAGLWIVGELDPQMLLAKGGFDIPPTRQLLIFHPRFMATLLAGAPAAIDEAPLKLVLLSAGPEVTVLRFPRPAAVFAAYPELAAMACELETVCRQIVSAVTGPARPVAPT